MFIRCLALISSMSPLLAGATDLAVRSGYAALSRYALEKTTPSPAQSQPLNTVVRITIPPNVSTVGGAMRYLLRRSGYALAPAASADPAMRGLLGLPLPEVHRHLGPTSVTTGLLTLAGPAWRLVTDPVHRLVSFELTEKYRRHHD